MSDTHQEASLAGALVSKGDVWCELRSEDSWDKIMKVQYPDRDSRFYSMYNKKPLENFVQRSEWFDLLF